MQSELRYGLSHVPLASREIEMSRSTQSCCGSRPVGTILILGDDFLALYKVIEFRGAIHDGPEVRADHRLYSCVGLSALLSLAALVIFAGNFRTRQDQLPADCGWLPLFSRQSYCFSMVLT